jgi:hypothetical protein
VHRIGSRDVIFHDRLAEAAVRALRSVPAAALTAMRKSRKRERHEEEV